MKTMAAQCSKMHVWTGWFPTKHTFLESIVLDFTFIKIVACNKKVLFHLALLEI